MTVIVLTTSQCDILVMRRLHDAIARRALILGRCQRKRHLEPIWTSSLYTMICMYSSDRKFRYNRFLITRYRQFKRYQTG